MSTKLKAGTATSGAVIDADTTGILELQSGSTPTTAISIDASQAVTIAKGVNLATTSGSVGIGTATPTSPLEVKSNAGQVLTLTSTASNIYGYSTDGTVATYMGGVLTGTGGFVGTASAHPYIFRTNNAEVSRLDTSGRLLMGCTSTPSTTVGGVLIGNQSTAEALVSSTGSYTGGSDRCLFINGNGTVGKISVSGSTTTYATSSDYRLKEDISPMVNALEKIAKLKPVTYNWKADGTHGEGFIAHELQEVCPDAVIGEKDAMNEDGTIKAQSIDTSFLVATLTAAIQELNAKVTALEAQLGAK